MVFTDIEMYIDNKNRTRKGDYNNVDHSKYNLDTCRTIFSNMLHWIKCNEGLLSLSDDNNLTKKFKLISQLTVERMIGKYEIIGFIQYGRPVR